MFLRKATVTVSFILSGALCLAVSFIMGIKVGDAFAYIDFCADSTSGRYIEHEPTLIKSCDGLPP